MQQKINKQSKYQVPKFLLNWFNLRPEEGQRTFLMFAVFTATSIGMLWVEQTSIALFLKGFGANSLPLIYITSAFIGAAIGVIYSWLQRNFPIQKVLIIVVLIMSLPLIIFRVGLEGDNLQGFIGLGTVFLLRLWIDAQEILNDLNAQLASNQLFNIREIKRTYPIISSGLLLADVIAGFSLPILLIIIGLKNVLICAFLVMLLGGFLLNKLTKIYHQSFPDNPIKEVPNKFDTNLVSQRRQNIPTNYILPLLIFFVMGKVLYLLVEFHYLGQLEVRFETNQLASFLGLFAGILGLFELITQWFVSSRAVEKLGVFIASMFLPIFLSIVGVLTILLQNSVAIFNLETIQFLFLSAIIIKFFDELLHYTLIAGIKPFLFQPLPLNIRGSIQTLIQGVAEPITTGITGVLILGIIATIRGVFSSAIPLELAKIKGLVFVAGIVISSIIWAISAWFLRSSYINLLIEEAEQGRLGFSNVDLTAFKRAIVEALTNKQTDTDKSSCIDLLAKIDPNNVTEILAPKLLELSPQLQQQSLEVMLRYPNPNSLMYVQKLIYSNPPLEILALSLRYVWLLQTELDLRVLKPYLKDGVEAILRSTAATLILQRGDQEDKEEAIAIVEQMLDSEIEKEKILAIETLKDGAPNFFIKRYLPKLLNNKKPALKNALFELISYRNLHEHYPLILQGLYEKSLRETAQNCLVILGNEVLPLLKDFTEDKHKPDLIKIKAWTCLGEIGTPQAEQILINQLMTSWGTTRRNLLRIILRIPNDQGLDLVMDSLGRNGVETLIDQELSMLGQIYAAKKDLNPISSREGQLLKESLEGMQIDLIERCFLLMKLLYPLDTIQAALLNLNSGNSSSIALGLELLDNGIDLPQKNLFLRLFEKGLTIKMEQLEAIKSTISYQEMTPYNRLLQLLNFRHFLSDWCLACCFHLATRENWTIPSSLMTLCLRNPHGFVREAVLTYLFNINPSLCAQLIPKMERDHSPIVSALIKEIKAQLN